VYCFGGCPGLAGAGQRALGKVRRRQTTGAEYYPDGDGDFGILGPAAGRAAASNARREDGSGEAAGVKTDRNSFPRVAARPAAPDPATGSGRGGRPPHSGPGQHVTSRDTVTIRIRGHDPIYPQGVVLIEGQVVPFGRGDVRHRGSASNVSSFPHRRSVVTLAGRLLGNVNAWSRESGAIRRGAADPGGPPFCHLRARWRTSDPKGQDRKPFVELKEVRTIRARLEGAPPILTRFGDADGGAEGRQTLGRQARSSGKTTTVRQQARGTQNPASERSSENHEASFAPRHDRQGEYIGSRAPRSPTKDVTPGGGLAVVGTRSAGRPGRLGGRSGKAKKRRNARKHWRSSHHCVESVDTSVDRGEVASSSEGLEATGSIRGPTTFRGAPAHRGPQTTAPLHVRRGAGRDSRISKVLFLGERPL